MKWRSARLGDVCAVERGSMITEKQTSPGSVPVVAGGIKPTYFHAKANRPPGVVTISASGANAGFVSYWDQPIWASDCTTVLGDVDHVSARFVFHQLKAIETSSIAGLRRGAAQPHVLARDVQELRVVVPPIEEQRRIAAVLDAADALRAKRRQALATLDTLTQAIFIDMFGDPDGKWPVVSVAELAVGRTNSIRTGPFGSQLLHSEFTDSGIAVLGIDNAVQNRFAWSERRFISEEKYQALQRYTVFPGDVIVTIMGTCGRAAIVPDDIPRAINTKHLCCITPDRTRCLPEYLWASLLYHPAVRRQLGAARGAVMPGLNMGLIKEAKLPLPPVSLQESFVAQLRTSDELLSQTQRQAAHLDALFASLQQRAFRGEL